MKILMLGALRDTLNIQQALVWVSRPDVRRRAGAEDADTLITVTSSDEVYVVACLV